MAMQARLKPLGERLLVRTLSSVRPRGRLLGRTAILAYHNIVAPEQGVGGDRSLHLPRARFTEQLDWLSRHCDVVPLTSVLEEPDPASERPRVAITFDDAYRGAVTAGVEELCARGLPATVFVAPGLVGGRSCWWDVYSRPAGAGLPADFRRRALEDLAGDEAAIRSFASAAGLRPRSIPDEATTATEDELRRAARHGGITFGSHSWSHRNLARLRGAELEGELVRSLAWLRQRFDRVIPWLSYPYGSTDPDVEAAAGAAGYRAGLRISGGAIRTRASRPHGLPRINVSSGLSLDGLVLRMSGWFGG